jgi:anti-sigma B factor antagonist
MADTASVTVEQRGSGTVVFVVGVLDAATLPAVSRALTDAQRNDRYPVYVDLSGVTFIDSRGLGALLAANERSREGAAAIRIHRPSAAVRRLLDVSGAGSVLTEAEVLPD